MLMATPRELEDTGGLSGFGAQEQISLRLGLAPIHQSSGTLLSLATLGVFAAQQRDAIQFTWAITAASLLKPDSATQSLTAAVDALAGTTEDQFLASLTDNDYQRLVTSLNKLIDIVGEDENHLLAPLMDFIDNLIKKYEEKIGMTVYLPWRRLRAASADDEPADAPDILFENSDYEAPATKWETQPLPWRRLRAASADDEPADAPDILFENSDYEAPATK